MFTKFFVEDGVILTSIIDFLIINWYKPFLGFLISFIIICLIFLFNKM